MNPAFPALVAQGIEHHSPKVGVVRSNRIEGTVVAWRLTSKPAEASTKLPCIAPRLPMVEVDSFPSCRIEMRGSALKKALKN